MSFPRYPAYKDSGVAWLGEVPEHWEATKTKYVVNFTTGWTPPTGDSASFDGANPWANISDLGAKVIHDTAKHISDGAVAILRIQKSPAGSLLFSFKLSIGQVSFAGVDLYTNEAIATFLPSSTLDLSFAYYALPLFLVQNAAENIYGAKLLNQQLMRSASFALAPLHEQVQIANFLDRETAKIDALIAEQQRLIELLQEKRQAVISHAVTKGLNPDAPMKDSGVEWLGEVPEHWEVCGLSHTLTAIGDVDHYMPATVAEGVPYLMTGDLRALTSQIDFNDCKQVSPEEYEKLSRKIKTSKGDLIMARYATIGTVTYVDVELDLLVSYSCVTIKPDNSRVDGMFLFFCLKSDSFAQGLRCKVNANTQENVGIGDLKKVSVAIPPYNEQQQICEYLQNATSGMTDVIQASQDTVRLLQERRSALISAAVTGQIDVRGLVAEGSDV